MNKELFKLMDELIAKGVSVNVACQMAVAIIQEKNKIQPVEKEDLVIKTHIALLENTVTIQQEKIKQLLDLVERALYIITHFSEAPISYWVNEAKQVLGKEGIK